MWRRRMWIDGLWLVATQAAAQDGAVAPKTSEVVVTGRLDAARDRIAPALGAVSYTLGPAQIAATLP